jgi:arylsulfatase A
VCAVDARAETLRQVKTSFLQILTDDQGWGDLHSFGHVFIETPHIDQLAAEGIKFTHCYASAAVCSPSRSSILTGRTPYRNGVYRWVPADHFCYLKQDEVTLPQLLRENGYQTAHFGKWHLSSYTESKIRDDSVPPRYEAFGYSTDSNQPTMTEYGYDYWFATGNVARPSHQNPENFFLNGQEMGLMEGFSAQIVAKELVKWLREERDASKPFFITLWFHEPHGPIDSDPKFMARYDRKVTDPDLKQYLANVTQIDEAVGAIVRAMKEEGVYDETLIWYTSDNGPEGDTEYGSPSKKNNSWSNRYRGSSGGLRGRKRYTHEGGIRVPGIISWPAGLKRNGVRPGGVSAEPIIGSDVFPTLLEIAGIELPEKVIFDSCSILPILENKTLRRPKPLYWRNNSHDFRIALRDGDWKIIGKADRTGFELYNLALDPRETTDLSAHEPAQFERLKKALIDYDDEVLKEGPDWWKRDGNVKNMPAGY